VLSVNDGRLSALDTAFLRLESSRAPMHLGALATFEPQERIPPARLVTVLGDRVARISLLRQRVRTTWLPPGAAAWTHDATFDLSRHIHTHKLKRGIDAMATLACELMAEPLDLSRPLWQLHLMTGLPGGRFALLIKLHHAMADGLRAVELSLRLLDQSTDLQPGDPEPDPTTSEVPPSTMTTIQAAAERAIRQANVITGLARDAMGLPRALSQATNTMSIAASLLSHVRIGALLPSAIGNSKPGATRTTATPANPPTAARRLALVRLDTHDVRRVRKRHGGTDHDVLLAVITGALRQWLASNDQRPQNLNMRAFIPVSRRSRSDQPHRSNMLSGYLCDLPIQEDDPITMLHNVRAAMDRNKAAGFTHGPGAFPVLADRLPAAAHHITTPLLRRAAPLLFDTMVTSVPIPSRPVTLAGAPLQQVYPIAPLACGQALSIALSAYQGTVHIGLHADRHALPDFDRLADAIPAALAALSAASGPPS
jgi:WS/DGAT/MGAT family acyltransferase